MSPTATVSPAFVASLKASQEALERAFAPVLGNLEALCRAISRTAYYKRKASKAALVAVLNEYAPRAARVLWATVSEGFERVARDLSPPLRKLLLVTSQGPHAPPVRSVIHHGALSG